MRSIGRGAAGSVILGRAPDGRLVAIKVLQQMRGDAFARFDRERRVLEELGSELFVPLLDAGEDGGTPYIVMPFMEGGTLRAKLEKGHLAIDEAISIATTLARALAVAHAKGILHRDLKPENVLFDAAGAARVADLGLAKHLDSKSIGLSVTGELRGTAGYMPREQMADAKSVGTQADVFALGAILYEMLAGHPAFYGESLIDVMGRVELGAYAPLARFRPETPRWLDRIVTRALAHDPARRFVDGAAFAEALALRRARPSRAVPLAVALATVALLAGGAAALALREAAPEAPAPVRPLEKEPREPAPEVAAPFVKPVVQPSGSRLRLAATWGSRRGKMNGPVSSIAFSFNGERVLTGSYYGSVTFTDAATGEETGTFRAHRNPVSAVAFSPDGTKALTGGHDGTIALWDLASRKPDPEWRIDELGGAALAFLESGRGFMAVGEHVTARRTDDGSLVGQVTKFKCHVLGMAYKRGRAVAGGADRKVRVFDVTGAFVSAFEGGAAAVSAVAISDDGDRVAAGYDDRTVRVWNVASGKELAVLGGHDASIVAVAFLPDRNGVATVTKRGSLREIDIATGQDLFKLAGAADLTCARYAPGLKRIGAGFADGRFELWTRRGERPRDTEGHAGIVASVRASPDGKSVASVGFDGVLRVRDAGSGTERVAVPRGAPLWGVAWSPDGKRLVVGGDGRTVDLVTPAGEVVASFKGHTGSVRSVAFAHDGASVLSAGGKDRTVRRWSLEGAELSSFAGHEDEVIAVAASPRSARALSASYDRTVRLQDAGTTDPPKVLRGHDHWAVAVAFAPDGAHAASGGWDKQFAWWDLDAGRLLWKKACTDWVTSVAVSPDGAFLAVGSVDRAIRYYRVDDQSLSDRANRNDVEDFPTALDFSPEGRVLYAGTARGVVERYEIDK